ncbi:hypothetical protein CVT24_008740 [Panaeolus cyanescens]|uniref:Uncharacterized protein n=1 Tax=Panaeolus cyanescens TaxID=181874 RepID=A0A409VCU5_9AGAR|nr:hypothetical protein CVT24_008740 [Panaeolus cyanescens]
MKINLFFSVFLCITSISLAVPLPGPGGKDKGKGKQIGSPGQSPPGSPPGSRSHTPTPSEDSDVPLPGRTGSHHDKTKNVVTGHYGDDRLPGHMAHVKENQERYPENRKPMPLASKAEGQQNRKGALHGVAPGHVHPVTKEPLVRDEKPLAMFHNDNRAETTTVMRLPTSESVREGGMTSGMQSTMQKHGSLGQIRVNPGWHPINPDQRIAHEAPARLNSETRNPNAAPPKKPKEQKPKGPAKQRVPKDKKPVDESNTYLIHGHQFPPGHVWKPNETGPPHAGAPVPNKESDRYPPRPQNLEAYRNRNKEPRPVTPPVGNPHPGPKSNDPKHNSDQFNTNLGQFTQGHPKTQRPAQNAASHETPPRLQSHQAAPAPANAPAQHTLPIRPPPPVAHDSRSGSKTGSSSGKPKGPEPKKGRN